MGERLKGYPIQIDNSRAQAFLTCPAKYWERYVNNLERDYTSMGAVSTFDFGSRFHELLDYHYAPHKGEVPAPSNPLVEDEAQGMFAAYLQQYPSEPFEVIDVERTFEVPLGERHTYVGKFDAIIRWTETGYLRVFETKSESRSSLRNLPKAWASRSQVSLYAGAAALVYSEDVEAVILNVCTRASDKGLVGPTFRRDTLQRSPEQIREAYRNIEWVADQITELERTWPKGEMWPANRENCMTGRWACDYYDAHLYGRDEQLIQLQFKPAKEYLSL